ncbi:sorting nexin 2B-like [Bidens hawaiensis]|uniref:sorting nexin 2B-like n=1 Tax=Bidens hawaiensis TaxID=980011 RepID=UPI00404ADE55
MMEFENQTFEDTDLHSLALNDDVDNNNSSPSSRSNGFVNGAVNHPLSSSSLSFAEIPTTDDDDVNNNNSNSNNPLLTSLSSHQNPNSFNSVLEPPSYADAVFGSFDRKQTNGAGAVSGATSSDYLKISVTDPVKEQDPVNSLVPGGNSFVTYLITTWTNIVEYSRTEFTVRRRFRDVVTLSDRLADSHRGYFIPLRPDKSVVESQVMQKQEFVEQRRVALEKYLRKLAAHPVIRKSEELRLFLQVQGKLPLMRTTDVASRMLDGAARLPKQLFGESVVSAVVDPSDVAQPAKGGRDLLRMFKELRQSVVNDWGGTKPPVVEEDKEFLEKRKKMQDFELELTNVSQQAEAFVKALQDMGETLGQLGLTFVKLTKFETEEAVYNSQKVRAADMKNVATSAVKASRLFRELNAQTVRHLDKLHEYLGVILAMNNAYADRSNALLTVQTLLSELANLNSRIEKLEATASKIFGGDRSRVRKIEELKETMRVTEEAKNCAVREYERIKENNKSELERLDKERHDDFFSMLKGFVVNQAGYAEKMASVWETVASETTGYAAKSS